MPVISLRISVQDEQKLNLAAKKSHLSKSEYVRKVLFSNENVGSKIDFYANINEAIRQIMIHSQMSTQLICHVLASQTSPETVQEIIKNIKDELGVDSYETRL